MTKKQSSAQNPIFDLLEEMDKHCDEGQRVKIPHQEVREYLYMSYTRGVHQGSENVLDHLLNTLEKQRADMYEYDTEYGFATKLIKILKEDKEKLNQMKDAKFETGRSDKNNR